MSALGWFRQPLLDHVGASAAAVSAGFLRISLLILRLGLCEVAFKGQAG